MSNANTNKSSNNTNPAAPAASPAAAPKPVVTPGDVKVSTGNAADAAASKPESNPTNATALADAGAAGEGASATDAGESDANPLMYCIVTGPVKQFKTSAKAEEFLNGPDAPNDYVIIRGRMASTKRKITLRD